MVLRPWRVVKVHAVELLEPTAALSPEGRREPALHAAQTRQITPSRFISATA
jgi:hypothetical protein